MNKRQDRLHEISTGYIQAKILLTAAEFRIFDLLKGPGATASEIAEKISGTLRGTEILLDALTAAELLSKQGEVYRNRPEYEAQLLSDSESNYLSLLRHRNRLFRRWAFLEEIISGDQPLPDTVEFSPGDDRQANEDFIRAMVAVSSDRADEVVAPIDLEGVQVVADLGGGPGIYLEAMHRARPEIEPYLCDLPLTLEVARKVQQDRPLGRSVKYITWDLYRDPPPRELPPIDLAFISQVLHGASPEANEGLLQRLYDGIAPGGRVVIHENIVDPSRITPRDSALFAVNMLAMTDGGRTYTEQECHAWGRTAGFEPEPGHRIDSRSFLVTLRRPR